MSSALSSEEYKHFIEQAKEYEDLHFSIEFYQNLLPIAPPGHFRLTELE